MGRSQTQNQPNKGNLELPLRAARVQGAGRAAFETYQLDRRKSEHRVTQQSGRAGGFRGFLKHGIDFADAVGVFYDELALTIHDQDHHHEARLITLGTGFNDRLLLVVNVQKAEGVIRIISARKATK